MMEGQGLGGGLLGRGHGSDVRSIVYRLSGTREIAETTLDVPVDAIEPNPWQPRMRMPTAELEQLARSIDATGLLHPPTVRRTGGRLQLLEGERRLRAVRLLGWSTLPVRVLEGVSDTDARTIALVENLARRDLTTWEEARGIAALRDALKAAGERAGVRELAKALGRSTGTISRRLKIADVLRPAALDEAGIDVQALNRLPEQALHAAAATGDLAEAARVLRKAAAADAPGKAARAAVAPTKREPDPPPHWTWSAARDGRISLRLRTPAAELPPREATALLERLEPVIAILRRRAKASPRSD